MFSLSLTHSRKLSTLDQTIEWEKIYKSFFLFQFFFKKYICDSIKISEKNSRNSITMQDNKKKEKKTSKISEQHHYGDLAIEYFSSFSNVCGLFSTMLFHRNEITKITNKQKTKKTFLKRNKKKEQKKNWNSFCLEKQKKIPIKFFLFPYVLRHNVTVIIYIFLELFILQEKKVKESLRFEAFNSGLKLNKSFSILFFFCVFIKFYFMFQ